MLAKQGFLGEVICTPPTLDLTEVILRDSAKIQMEDALYANEKGFSKHHPAQPLYDEEDVDRILGQMRTTEEGTSIEVLKNVNATFWRNGHILGSSFIEINCFGKTLIFSGDLGRPVSALLHPPKAPGHADYLIMESTYGDRVHSTSLPSDELAEIILDTFRGHGNLLIPSFAVGRAQELMHLINELKKLNRIPDIPVYLDSPMGADATQIFVQHPKWHKLTPEACESLHESITIIRKFEDTIQVMRRKESKIVIAASGMLTGGRVLFYLENYLKDKRNTILFTGYQSEGTRGRALMEGAREIRMHGAYVKVAAKVCSLSSMSAHADQKEMMDWMGNMKKAPSKVFLVHGENSAREAFRVKIQEEFGWTVETPLDPDEVGLFEVH
jgi:metallo-beta-lactamase family protein